MGRVSPPANGGGSSSASIAARASMTDRERAWGWPSCRAPSNAMGAAWASARPAEGALCSGYVCRPARQTRRRAHRNPAKASSRAPARRRSRMRPRRIRSANRGRRSTRLPLIRRVGSPSRGGRALSLSWRGALSLLAARYSRRRGRCIPPLPRPPPPPASSAGAGCAS